MQPSTGTDTILSLTITVHFMYELDIHHQKKIHTVNGIIMFRWWIFQKTTKPSPSNILIKIESADKFLDFVYTEVSQDEMLGVLHRSDF